MVMALIVSLILFGIIIPLTIFLDMAGKNELKFGIESKVSCDRTSTYAFKKDITNALNEMKEVCIIAIENSKNDVKCRL